MWELCLEGRSCYCLAQQNLSAFGTLLYLDRFVLTSACMRCVLQLFILNINICPLNLGEKYIIFSDKKTKNTQETNKQKKVTLGFSYCQRGQLFASIQMKFVLLVLQQLLSNPYKVSMVSAAGVLQRIFFLFLLHCIGYHLITS